MKHISASFFLWGVVSAWVVAGAAEIAVHPLHIETAPAGATVNALKQAFQEQVSKTLPERADAAEVERYLRQQGETSCWGDDGCIAAMARALRVKQVLLVSVVRTEPWIIMSARVLDAKGAELQNIPVTVYTPDPDVSEGSNFADGFLALFTALNLTGLSADVPAPSTTKATASREGLSSMRVASYATAGVAAVGLVTGVTFTVLFFKNNNKFKNLLREEGVSSAENSAEALKYMQRSQDNRLYLFAGYALGAAAAAASVTLFFLSPEYKDKAAVSFVPLQGGGALTVAASF